MRNPLTLAHKLIPVARAFWTVAATIARDPTDGRRLVQHILSRYGGHRLPTVDLADLVPLDVQDGVQMTQCAYRYGNLTAYELLALGALLRRQKPLNVMELGTYDGNTTLHMARNVPRARIFTVDMDKTTFEARGGTGVSDALPFAQIGWKWRHSRYAPMITPVTGDLATMDLSPWYGLMDCVFIDAGHAYQDVARDTLTAKLLLRAGGMILWHDYHGYQPVQRFLNTLERGWYRLGGLQQIRGTSLVVWRDRGAV